MKVFISWSGDRSKELAGILREWLPTIIQSLELFISTQDIPPGGRGLNVLASELQDCSYGILCLAQDNRERPWINFEAGALSKVIEASKVVPLLLDLKPSDITGPLTQFQAIVASNREDVFRLVESLAEHSDPPKVPAQVLERTFNTFWPEFAAKVSDLKAATRGRGEQTQARSERDILEEILTLSRRNEREFTRIVKSLMPIRPELANYTVPSIAEARDRDPISRTADLLKQSPLHIHDMIRAGSVLRVIIDDKNQDEQTVRRFFSSVANVYKVTIHVSGVPLGEETFDPWGRVAESRDGGSGMAPP